MGLRGSAGGDLQEACIAPALGGDAAVVGGHARTACERGLQCLDEVATLTGADGSDGALAGGGHLGGMVYGG